MEHLDGQRSSRSAVVSIETGKPSRESQEIWEFFKFRENEKKIYQLKKQHTHCGSFDIRSQPFPVLEGFLIGTPPPSKSRTNYPGRLRGRARLSL